MHNELSFLIIALRRIGDVLLNTPLIHSLRQAHPTARIDALVFQGTGGILQGNPDLNNVYEIPHKLRFAEYRAFWQTHGRRYDWSIATQSGDRPTLLALLAGRQTLVPFTGESGKDVWRKWLLNRTLPINPNQQHVVQRYLDLALVLTIPPVPLVIPPQAPQTNVAQWLSFNPAQQPFVVCHPMPMFRYKQWEDAQWRILIQACLTRGYRVVISCCVCTAELAAIQTLLGDLSAQVTNLAGKLRFAELAEVLRKASHYYGTDTSVTHLAAATGIPVTAIFGPTDPSIWGPLPNVYAGNDSPWQACAVSATRRNVTIVQDTLACVPCQAEGCERHIHSHSQCLQNITADSLPLPPHFHSNAAG